MPGSPKKHKSDSYTLTDFQSEFPTDDACLDWLWRHLYSEDGSTADCPKCGKPRRFHRVKSRHSYSCDTCGHHVHPTSGTIFEKSTTPLRSWFHAVFILSQTRCGISAMQLKRELDVTYKTAWRMFNLIRQLLQDDDDTPLSGEVDMDETAWGGRIRAADRSRAATSTQRRQEAMERVKARPTILGWLSGEEDAFASKSWITAAWISGRSFTTTSVRTRPSTQATGSRISGSGGPSQLTTESPTRTASTRIDTFITQTIEGFFGNVRRGLSGVQHNVSRKWLELYVQEFAFKYNHRADGVPMFKVFLGRVQKAVSASASSY